MYMNTATATMNNAIICFRFFRSNWLFWRISRIRLWSI